MNDKYILLAAIGSLVINLLVVSTMIKTSKEKQIKELSITDLNNKLFKGSVSN